MTLRQAEDLVKELQDLIADESSRGARRNPWQLPASKPQLMTAIKLLVAQLYLLGADDKQRLEPLLRAAMALDSFNDMPVGATEFIVAMQSRKRELEDFRAELLGVRRDHPYFWQRVYPLAGVDIQSKRTTFFENLKYKLSNLTKSPEPVESEKPAYDYASGRYEID